jgi:preprotein translocase subunit Sec61beta
MEREGRMTAAKLASFSEEKKSETELSAVKQRQEL